VEAATPAILGLVEFNEGHRYSDFDPGLDKVAAVGIGGLIAGKVAAKIGLLKGIGLFLAKGWKVVVIAIAAVGALIAKLFGKSKAEAAG